jgi:hypothetical protein
MSWWVVLSNLRPNVPRLTPTTIELLQNAVSAGNTEAFAILCQSHQCCVGLIGGLVHAGEEGWSANCQTFLGGDSVRFVEEASMEIFRIVLRKWEGHLEDEISCAVIDDLV